MLVYLGSERFLWKKNRPEPTAPATTQVANTPAAPSAPANTAQPTIIPLEQTIPNVAIRNDIVLENDVMKVVFSNLGGCVRQVYLKKFQLADKKTTISLIPANLDLVNLNVMTSQGEKNLGTLPMQYEMYQDKQSNGVRFYIESQGQRILEKRYQLTGRYGVSFSFQNAGYAPIQSYDVRFGSGIADTEMFLKNKNQDYKFIAQIQNETESVYLNKLKEKKDLNGKTDWAVIRSKYFLLGILPDKLVTTEGVSAFKTNESPAFNLHVNSGQYRTQFTDSYRLYFGPAVYKELLPYGYGFENASERGAKWLRWLVDIFLFFLTWLYKIIPNYGIVIIIFSLILKVVLHPLTHKSMESSIKMQRIQPMVREIQKRYKNDPKRLQTELSALYKDNKVNPLGGCLPLLLQMPIFFALYTALRYAIDLRQAHFVGWLKDLSEPDPLLILPILMAIFMFVQQKMMTPAQQGEVDEKQQAMMQSQKMMLYIMPVMMFFIFKSLPAGLVLYWTIFNVFSIVQQYYLQRHFNGKES